MSSLDGAASPEFAHRRAVPEAWPGLLERAQSLIDSSLGHDGNPVQSPDNIDAMHAAIAGLDNEALEANRFYGLGMALCHFARHLSDPNIHSRIVDDAVSELQFRASQEGDPYKPGMQVSRIGGYSKEENPWDEISHMSVDGLLPAQRLLAESLYAAHNIRSAREPDAVDTFTEVQAHGYSFIAESLASNADAGVSLVLKRGLMARAPQGVEDVTVNECIDRAELPAFISRLRKPAVSLARTRIDEIQYIGSEDYHPIQDAEGVDSKGDWTFDRRYLDTPPTENPDLLYTTRLECPAIQVPGLIPLVSGYAADIVRVADQAFTETYVRTEGAEPTKYADPGDYRHYIDEV